MMMMMMIIIIYTLFTSSSPKGGDSRGDVVEAIIAYATVLVEL